MIKVKTKKIKNHLTNLDKIRLSGLCFDNAPDAIFIANPKTKKIVECNKAAEKLIGYSKKRILSMTADRLHPKDLAKKTMRAFKDLAKNSGTFRTEVITKNKKRVPVSINAKLVVINGRRYLQGIFRNIAGVILEERKTTENEERFRSLFEHANDAIWLMDKDVFIDCNLRALKMFACRNRKDMVNHTPQSFSPTKQPDGQSSKKKALMYINKALKGQPQRFYWQHKKKNGVLFDTEISLNRIILLNNTYVQAIGRDVSRRYKIQKKLEESNELVNNARSIILKWDRNEKITFVNDYGAELFGYNKKELIGKNVGIFVPKIESTGRKLTTLIKKITKNPQKYFSNQNENIKKDGKRFWVDWSNKAIKRKDGKKKEILAVGIDNTKRKEAEIKLAESEERFRNIFNFAAAGVSRVATNGRFLEVNNALCKIVGYSRKELLSENFNDITFKEDRAIGPKMMKRLLAGKTKFANFEKRYVHKNGHLVWVNINTSVVRDYLGKPLYFITHTQNITALKENEQRYRRLFESAKDSILILDSDSGEIIDSNPFVQELLGYSSSRLIGKKIFEISPLKDIVENKKKFLELKNKGYVYYNNLPLETKDGRSINVEFVSNAYFVGDKKVIQCNIRDITKRITQESELEQAKNDFMSMTSHQLRTPLSAIKWILESLMTEKNYTTEQKNKLNDLIVSNERLINLVNKLLSVTRIESGKLVINKKLFNVKELLNNLTNSLKPLADKKDKKITVIIPPKLNNIFYDPILLNEALENLLKNAIDYSGENNKIITVSIKDRAKDYIISVHNSGIINKSIINEVKKFEKFSRGHDSQKAEPVGSGLGLYITKKIVEASGGRIWLESNARSRTTFYFTINKKSAPLSDN